MKNLLKKPMPNPKQLADFQTVAISAKAQKKIKGGADIVITDVVTG